MTGALSPDEIFSLQPARFEEACLETYRFQYHNNKVYRQFSDLLGKSPNNVNSLPDIPFLPVQFFKTHRVSCVTKHDIVFQSSGTTGDIPSSHFVADISLYERSFKECFRLFYGDPADWIILAFLPSYLERENSSLVYMADRLISLSKNSKSRFVLGKGEELKRTLPELVKSGTKIMLIGVTYALLDHAEQYPDNLGDLVIMETGGMKGRREELTRPQVHEILKNSFRVKQIHSEYGMTELLSQAYSAGNGVFRSPRWMKVVIRNIDDPQLISLPVANSITGATNIIDLANQYSCSFIATDDLCKLHPDDTFEILGRIDNCDIRGCSLMTA